MNAAVETPGSGRRDVIVVGAGPAGSALALLLAKSGRDVALVHRNAPHAGIAEETIVASAGPLLERLGLLGLARPRTGQGRIWGEQRLARGPRTASGFQVVRSEFDECLRGTARAAGGCLVDGRVLHPLPTALDGEVLVQTPAGNGPPLHARVTALATGRSTTDASFHVEAEMPATVALSARVETCGEEAVIEAVPEGWWWLLPGIGSGAELSLFADLDEIRERGRDEVWRAAVAGASGPARDCAVRPERATDATARLRKADAGCLLVGDAASSIDPLSSQGLEKALASAEHAALCIETLLEGACDPALVLAHRVHWESRLWRAHRRETIALYRAERRFAGAPFWRARHAQRDSRLDGAGRLPTRLRPSDALEEAPTLRRRDGLLQEVRGWRAGPEREPLWRIGSAPVRALLEACPRNSSPRDALDCAARHPELCALSAAAVERGLVELLHEGLLVEAS